jgi:2-iminobutanoate/2-iminopropanoate deaminase
MKQKIETTNAPAAVGPFSQGIRFGKTLFVSGQLPIDPATGTMCSGDIADCARQSLRNLAAVVEAAGATMNDVLKVTVFLTDMADFATVNGGYAEFFEAPFPARSAFAVAGLPLGARVEAEAIVGLP